MTNGLHTHKCQSCGEAYECAKVTHCKQSYEVAACPDCYYERYKRESAALPTDEKQDLD